MPLASMAQEGEEGHDHGGGEAAPAPDGAKPAPPPGPDAGKGPGKGKGKKGGPASDKKSVEIEVGYRWNREGEVASVASFNVQPMSFIGRRIHLGTRFVIEPVVGDDKFNDFEFDAFVGYQHFLDRWAVPYVRAITGITSETVPEGRQEFWEYGAEAGLKLYIVPAFSLNLAGGVTRSTPWYGTVGLTMGMGSSSGVRAAFFDPIIVGLIAAILPVTVDWIANAVRPQ